MNAMPRRRALALLGVAGLTTLLWALPALAGSYLSRAGILLRAGETEARALGRRPHDKELSRIVHGLSVERLKRAREMEVPKEVVKAHPHLLLVLESYERAADAAQLGKHESMLISLSRAREERRTFESVLGQLGWTLPKD